MKCPLMLKVWEPGDERRHWESIDCLKEKCAWWDEEDGRCALLSLMGDIRVISEVVRNIALKMPT